MSESLLSAAQILGAADLSHEDVDVPEWGGQVRIQQLNAEEIAAFSADQRTIGTGDGLTYLMFIHAARDADGQRLFDASHLPALVKKNFNVLNRLNMQALSLNKIDAVGTAALKKD